LESQNIAKQHRSENGVSYLYLYRPARIMGAGVTPDIYINGRLIGPIDISTFQHIKLLPGKYQISGRLDGAYLLPDKLTITTQGNKNIYVRVYGTYSDKAFVIVDSAEAIEDISELSLVESNEYL
jgi:hypothetical protein